jgi:hypothetical protein
VQEAAARSVISMELPRAAPAPCPRHPLLDDAAPPTPAFPGHGAKGPGPYAGGGL